MGVEEKNGYEKSVEAAQKKLNEMKPDNQEHKVNWENLGKEPKNLSEALSDYYESR